MNEEKNVPMTNEEPKKGFAYYAKTAGILTAIGVSSALLITGLNLVTAPIIEQRQNEQKGAGYKVVFPELDKVSEATKVENATYVTEYCSALKNETELGKVFTATGKNSRASYDLLIGLTGDGDAPSVKNVYIVKQEMTPGYDETFKNYYDNFIASPDDTHLNDVKNGATLSSSLFRDMVKEAKSVYATISGGVTEKLEEEVAAIYGDRYYFDAGKETSLSGDYLYKYYPMFDMQNERHDEGGGTTKDVFNEAARIYSLRYSGDDGKLGIALGISGDVDSPKLEKMYLYNDKLETSVQSLVDGYNSSLTEDYFAGKNETLGAMVKAAVDHYKASALDNIYGHGKELFDAFDHNGEAKDLEKTFKTTYKVASYDGSSFTGNSGNGKLIKAWPALDKDGNEIGAIYFGSVDVALD
ncbi:MAG: hypothetical protein HUJ60_06050, partial [Bacilli bacterium]|nr:hypothetical protein [Bacilli bacterium]